MLNDIEASGLVHCDLKPDQVGKQQVDLNTSESTVKINPQV